MHAVHRIKGKHWVVLVGQIVRLEREGWFGWVRCGGGWHRQGGVVWVGSGSGTGGVVASFNKEK